MLLFKLTIRVILLLLVICPFISSCASNDILDEVPGISTLDGTHYIKDNISRDIFLSSLQKDWQLKMASALIQIDMKYFEWSAPPMEASSFCYLFKDGKLIKTINSLNDLKGYVNISTEEQAIEYVRLITSGLTNYLFRPEIMTELFNSENNIDTKGRLHGKCSTIFFQKHSIKNMICIKKDNYFEIQRYVVICPWPGATSKDRIALARLVEKIYSDGSYILDKKDTILEWKWLDEPDGMGSYPLEPF